MTAAIAVLCHRRLHQERSPRHRPCIAGSRSPRSRATRSRTGARCREPRYNPSRTTWPRDGRSYPQIGYLPCGTSTGPMYPYDDCNRVVTGDVTEPRTSDDKYRRIPEDRSTGWMTQPAVHLFDRGERGFAPRERVVDRELYYQTRSGFHVVRGARDAIPEELRFHAGRASSVAGVAGGA